MPVERTTKVTACCELRFSDETFVEAVPWANNLFRLTSVSYWTFTTDWVPYKEHVRHRRLSDEEKKVILLALVREWNLYSPDKLDPEKCALVLED